MISDRLFAARLTAGEGILFVASALAKLGRAVGGLPVTKLRDPIPKGSSAVRLNHAIPPFTRGLNLKGPEMMEIVKVRAVQGDVVLIDRKLAQDYERGAEVKVLL